MIYKGQHSSGSGAMQGYGGFEAYMLRGYTQVLGRRAEDLQIILALAKSEVRDPNVHTYVQFHITYGQKPQ